MLHVAVGGGLLLLVTCLLMRWTRQPARRQRLGEWGVTAALLVGLLSLVGPSWLVVAWNRGESQAQQVIYKRSPLIADDIHQDVERVDPVPREEPAVPVKHEDPAPMPHALNE